VSYSLGLLKVMGIKIASTLLETNKHEPEQKLWQAVLVNAFEDVLCNASDKKSAIAKWQANEWFKILMKKILNLFVICLGLNQNT
jgi:hypothetical protein